ncbi:phosphoglycerate kinase [Candidatus Roizmanbacteria bacterium RIFCSPLOWO2_01_FULL_37_12]|uniref:Phosphoglycerate kinase n=1 Tax=Candidatus Roizmanbacteria bacterium RIFCSPLOWO2_01_FULL_37_12 TaxID=1802056 RepID=A0A1F7ICG1_9BACT|nr:MAG: phosphoglycerate kinase [Candidatus Roizmanbacteria bacterium RIFCSPLOWO2_01_FULL_37_12]
MPEIKFIDEVEIKDKQVILRVDFNVTLNPDFSIADDVRIRQSLPTINYLLKNNNRLIIISHLGRPKGVDTKFSLKPVVEELKELLNPFDVMLINNFLNPVDKLSIKNQKSDTVLVLENIRFYQEEKNNDNIFARDLAGLGEIFVNDAFGVSHRNDASIVGIPKYIPSYGGLLLKKETETIEKIIKNPEKPVVAILGGAKISTKINLVEKLIDISDYLLIGGALANTFFCAKGLDIGKSYCEYNEVENAKKLLFLASKKHAAIILPSDVVARHPQHSESGGEVKKIKDIEPDDEILDIGPETQAEIGSAIAKAKTIIWNGPMGYIEERAFTRGTDFVYYSIAQNSEAVSLVGGGDTLAAISKKEYLDKITHISTGGGAMLEFIEKGTLPGIEALKR